MQRRLAAGAIEGTAKNFAVNRHHTLNRIGEFRYEPLKDSAKPSRIEVPKQPAERVVAGHTVLKLEKTAQQRLFRFGEARHGHRALTAA